MTRATLITRARLAQKIVLWRDAEESKERLLAYAREKSPEHEILYNMCEEYHRNYWDYRKEHDAIVATQTWCEHEWQNAGGSVLECVSCLYSKFS